MAKVTAHTYGFSSTVFWVVLKATPRSCEHKPDNTHLKNLDIFNGLDLYAYAVAATEANDDAITEAAFLDLV